DVVESAHGFGKPSVGGYLLQARGVFPVCLPVAVGLAPANGRREFFFGFRVRAAFLPPAWVIDITGIQGPFEKAHRRLSYGPTMQPGLKAPVSSTANGAG